MPVNLTANAISAINGGDVNSKPLLQVLDIKLIGSSQERYRILLSDGISSQHAMLATQLNDRVKTGRVKKGSVIQLIDYICSMVQSRKIIVLLNMETIISDCEIIGNPKVSTESETTFQKQLPNGNLKQSIGIGNNKFNAQNSSNSLPSYRSTVQPSHQPPANYSAQTHGSFVPSYGAQNHGNNVQSFRPSVQPPYQPPPNYRNQGPIVKNEAPARIIPIAALNPYQGRWAIKARVTAKGDLRRYNNARGDGKVFSFDLLDSDGGEIRVTCFNAVVDRFYDVIEVGRVYFISKGSLKPAQKTFNHLKNEWEIFLEVASTVDLCPEEDASIPRQQFSFRPISDIESAESNSIFDVIGIVTSVNPSVPILRKNGMETQRRIVNLKDDSARTVELTLWGDFCNKEGQKLQEMVDAEFFPVLAVKAAKISDFSGKSIGSISSTQLFINPDIPEARSVRQWFEHGGKNVASVFISRDTMPGGPKNEIRKTVSQIKDEGLGRSDKPDWVTVRAAINFIKADNFCYTACPLMIGDRQCNKKVTMSGNSRWQCDRCNQEFEECDYRYLLQAQIQDHTGATWVTAFQESGEEILGCSAKELYKLKYELEDDVTFTEVMRRRLFYQYLLRLKIKEEMYGDEQRVKITVVKVDPVNYSSESRYLLDLISNFRTL
ncbi:tRNA_anti domain-containing protein/Rep-A_N domain-containing protein/Rep_fac-A_C domain-containing protein [Cephalotus follicularis]|uniref:Replication protein A subunit n=1 Tax=Cephalotus follicularis TaxID=3775 RepID=A0A1Q3CVW8_CEPFO|nr:tRNA_anti domain-containing protein/Rep-A_N domain-containing protein/Rep_fac-A_C domain-containing protein [Cephalotus follicularis]